MAGSSMNPEIAQAILASAGRLGISPVDLATVISYETGGKMSPSTWGGKGGNYLGLIQFGPEEQRKYGVRPDQSVTDQMGSVENFLKDRGLKPGMGLMDTYSTVNAGAPGLYGRSDANNGGMPGNVMDKVNSKQMADHRANAARLFGGTLPQIQSSAALSAAPSVGMLGGTSVVPSATSAAPAVATPETPEDSAATMASLQNIAKMLQPQQANPLEAPANMIQQQMAKARAIAASLRQQQQPQPEQAA